MDPGELREALRESDAEILRLVAEIARLRAELEKVALTSEEVNL